jgi:hypothetical protein
MSLTEIEAELQKLTSDELRHLALRSCALLIEKQGRSTAVRECSEDDPDLLAALDEALARADAAPEASYTEDEVRARIREWTSK